MLFSGGAVAAPLQTGFPGLWPAGTPSLLRSSVPAILNCLLLLELTVLSGGFIRKLRILQFQDSFQGPGRASSNFTFKILRVFFVLFCFKNTVVFSFPFQICKFQAPQNLAASRSVLLRVSIFSASPP